MSKRKRTMSEKELNEQFSLFQKELSEVQPEKKRRKVKNTISVGPTFTHKSYKKGSKGLKAQETDEPVIIGSKEYNQFENLSRRKKKKSQIGNVRNAGGEVWKDDTLADFPDNDYRIFVGDLGPEATDLLLKEAFSKYSSFAMARVIKDRRTKRNRGYGFVSFLDPDDFTKALLEMDGEFIGSHPCRLRKSSWQDRDLRTKRKKGEFFLFNQGGKKKKIRGGNKKKKAPKKKKIKNTKSS